jgi:Chaperone of endosialidase/Secretion system C-terminal sorting domain
MKRIFNVIILAAASFAAYNANAQVFYKPALNGTIPATNLIERLTVVDGLMSHRVAGTVGSLGATDQWAGIGSAFISGSFNNSIYGLRVQRNGQGLLYNLNGNNGVIAWGPVAGSKLSVNFIQNVPAQTLTETFRHTKNNEVQGDNYALNGLLGHYVNGTYGAFGATDQWIGIGRPYNGTTPITSIYGNRIQWNNQAFIQALRDNGAGTKDAIVEWGNQGGNFRLRYITNPALPTGFQDLMFGRPNGSVLFGTTASGTLSGFTPRVETNFTAPAGTFFNTASYGEAAGGLINIGSVGASALATNTPLINLGVYGNANNASNNWAVFGFSNQAPNNFAGYFNGNVTVLGTFTNPSDEKLKIDVIPEELATEKLSKLNPVTYTFNPLVTRKLGMNTPEGIQHGLIAQNVELVYPELVTNIQVPGQKSDGSFTGEVASFKSVNYVGIISILIKASQELQDRVKVLEAAKAVTASNARAEGAPQDVQTLVSSLEARIRDLEQKLAATKGINEAPAGYTLTQNTPNPFTSTTTIRYTLPADVRNATLAIFDMSGRLQQQYNNLNGSSQVLVNGGSLQPGMYTYALLVKGQEVMSKKMILTR